MCFLVSRKISPRSLAAHCPSPHTSLATVGHMPIPKPFTGKVIGLDGYELAAVQVLLSEHMATRETGNTTPSKLEIGQQSPR